MSIQNKKQLTKTIEIFISSACTTSQCGPRAVGFPRLVQASRTRQDGNIHLCTISTSDRLEKSKSPYLWRTTFHLTASDADTLLLARTKIHGVGDKKPSSGFEGSRNVEEKGAGICPLIFLPSARLLWIVVDGWMMHNVDGCHVRQRET